MVVGMIFEYKKLMPLFSTNPETVRFLKYRHAYNVLMKTSMDIHVFLWEPPLYG